MTRAPSARKRAATARPRLPAAPVTMHVLPSRTVICTSLPLPSRRLLLPGGLRDHDRGRALPLRSNADEEAVLPLADFPERVLRDVVLELDLADHGVERA